MQNLLAEFIKNQQHSKMLNESSQMSVASQMINLDWKKIYILPRQTVISTNIRMFQNPLLNNILYFNTCLYKMKLVESPLCSQSKTVDETFFHFFSACPATVHIWEEPKKWLSPKTQLPPLTPQNGIVEDEPYETDDIKLINHILLPFKHLLYNRRDVPTLPDFF